MKIITAMTLIIASQFVLSCKSKPVQPASAAQPEIKIDRDIYRQAIRTKENQDRLVECYKSLNLRDANAEGRLVFDFEIDDQAKVVKLAIDQNSSTLKEEQFKVCMISEASKIRFPAAPKDTIVEVKYPFILQKKK